MKNVIKPLVALAAMSGVACAVDPFAEFVVVGEGTHTNNTGWGGGPPTQLLVQDMDGGTLSPATTWAHVNSVSFNQAEGSFTTNGAGVVQYLNQGQSGVTANNVSYSFDADWTLRDEGFSILTSIGEDASYAESFRIGISDGKWTIKAQDLGTITLSNQASVEEGTTSGSGSYLVSCEGSSSSFTLNVYGDAGKTLLVSATAASSPFDNAGNMKIGFGGCFGDNSAGNVTATFSNVKLYNQAIPEPATATLSLLALAGLAARRRRK